MFKLYRDESYRERMLQGLVEWTNNSTNNPCEVEIRINILIFLVQEEEGTAHSILSMMCKVSRNCNFRVEYALAAVTVWYCPNKNWTTSRSGFFFHHENGDFSILMKDIPPYYTFGFWNLGIELNNGNVFCQWWIDGFVWFEFLFFWGNFLYIFWSKF